MASKRSYSNTHRWNLLLINKKEKCWITLIYLTFCQIMCFNKILMVFVRFFYAHTKTPWFEVDSFVWWRWHSLSSSSLLVLLSVVVAIRCYPSNIASTILVFFSPPIFGDLGLFSLCVQKTKTPNFCSNYYDEFQKKALT